MFYIFVFVKILLFFIFGWLWLLFSLLGLLSFGPALGIGVLVGKTQEATARQPEVGGRLFTNMIIGAGMVEALALIGFVMPLVVK